MSGAKQRNNKVILTENTLQFERSQVSIVTGIINDPTVIPTNGRPGDLLITIAGNHYKKK